MDTKEEDAVIEATLIATEEGPVRMRIVLLFLTTFLMCIIKFLAGFKDS